MITPKEPSKEGLWRCLDCHDPLISNGVGLHCSSCRIQYPVIMGIPILVKEPVRYVRSELASLSRASRDGKQHREQFDQIGRGAGLTNVSLERHRDVTEAAMARAKRFLTLLEPARKTLEALPTEDVGTPRVRHPGWSFDNLLPCLLRDWTNTPELEAANSVIDAALKQVFPDPAGKIVAIAGCGAGGLLAEISSGFERILGFDLALPVLAAARHLLDGKSLDLALPHAINKSGQITLRKRALATGSSHVDLLAMDACDTAFTDGSIDCVITSFLLDLIPDPRKLADELHRILSEDGVWMNYGPSGPLTALWRFDREESDAFFEAAGFAVVHSDAHRATYLDISQDCPSWSFQNHICYLTVARKAKQSAWTARVTTPSAVELPKIIPRHLPAAKLIQQQDLGAEQSRKILLRHERMPGRVESSEISGDAARLMALVDGKRTVQEIAHLLEQTTPPIPIEQTTDAFERYFNQGLLSWT
jgi:SAM-dependent methyltransferase